MKPAVDPTDVDRFRNLVRARTGMAFPNLNESELEWAVQRAAADSGESDAEALYRRLTGPAASDAPVDALISALNVSETYFFRDAGQVQALEERILPELISRRRPERRLRLWSAGCSTGEEAYTLAILVKRLLTDISEWDVLILATDINGRSLEKARRGLYSPWSFRGTSPPELIACVTPHGKQFEVVPSVRAMVTFAELNLAEDVYPSLATNTQAMDLVLCRNVLLYFDEEGGRAVVGRLGDSLSAGGRLLVSRVEAGLGVFDGLSQDAPGTAVYSKPSPATTQTEPGPTEPAAVRHHAGRPKARARASAAAPPIPRRTGGAPPARVPGERPIGETGTSDPQAAHDEALELWKSGLAETALQRLEPTIKSNPRSASLHYLYGLLLIDAKRTDEALMAFRRCTFADPEFALGHLAQAHLLARMGLRSRALAPLETSARLVANIQPDTSILHGDGLTVGDVLELIAAERVLIAGSATATGSHARSARSAKDAKGVTYG